jgi:hypothetical protein
VAFIRLVQGQRVIAPAVYHLCLGWDVALPTLDTVRAYLGHSKLAVNHPEPTITRFLTVAPGGSLNASSTFSLIRGETVCCRSPDVRRDFTAWRNEVK